MSKFNPAAQMAAIRKQQRRAGQQAAKARAAGTVGGTRGGSAAGTPVSLKQGVINMGPRMVAPVQDVPAMMATREAMAVMAEQGTPMNLVATQGGMIQNASFTPATEDDLAEGGSWQRGALMVGGIVAAGAAAFYGYRWYQNR
jgi:hypothetical protein